jgi:hypothetical protein
MTGTFLHLERIDDFRDDEFQTLGRLVFYENFTLKHEWVTIEPPWKDNAVGRSCIPNGEYHIRRRTSVGYGRHFEVLDILGREYILIHVGNFKRETRGCILPGQSFVDIDGDNHKDVVNSRMSLQEMLAILPQGDIPLLVTSEYSLV